MSALKKPIWELFARARAQGNNRTRAAELAGYSVKRSSSQGCVLDKRAEIIARIAELNAVKAELIAAGERRVMEATGITKDYVLLGIVDGIEMAREQKKPTDGAAARLAVMAHRAAEEIDWDGDLSKLSDHQLQNLARSLRKLADPEVVARVERQFALESGEIIDVEPIPAAPEEGQQDGW